MERKQIIKTIIELHNFFIIEYAKYSGDEVDSDRLWDLNLLEIKPDRYYLVEGLVEESWDSEKDIKTYVPKTQVRYLLRSKEANKYGKGHQAFYDRYLSTISIENKYLDNPQGYKDKLIKDLDELRKKYV